jgi:hypothetical protein
MFRRSFLGVAAAVLLSAAQALAHHAFSADFDRDKPIALDGRVTKVEWTNPHAYLYLDVKDNSGKTATWKVELGNRDDLTKLGWTAASLTAGKQLSMRGWQAKNGSKFANAASITMNTGDKLSAASSYYLNPGQTDTLAQHANEPRAVGTSGQDGNALPRTASPLMFIGLLGALSSLGSLALNRTRC